MRKFRKTMSMILCAAMLAGLAGCSSGSFGSGSGTAAPTGAPEGTGAPGGEAGTKAAQEGTGSITYVTLGDTGMELLKEAAAEFKAETGIEVKLESWAYSDAYQKILTLAEGGNMPDAMYGFSSWTQQFKEAGYTVAINDLISEELYNDFSEGALKVCSVGDELWAMPSYMSIRGISGVRREADRPVVGKVCVHPCGRPSKEHHRLFPAVSLGVRRGRAE